MHIFKYLYLSCVSALLVTVGSKSDVISILCVSCTYNGIDNKDFELTCELKVTGSNAMDSWSDVTTGPGSLILTCMSP